MRQVGTLVGAGWLAVGIIGPISESAAAQSTQFTYAGDSAGDRAGSAVSVLGDVNHDGYDDVIIGAPYDDAGNQAGSVRIVSGKDGAVLRKVQGISPDDEFGYAVAGVGDVDLDGTVDFAVGAISGGSWSGLKSFNGVAGTRSGKHTNKVLAVLGEGATAGARFGFSVANAGDVNSDGRDDLIAGAPYDKEQGYNSGRVWVYSGKKQAILHVFEGTGYDLIGWSVAGVGDTDLDGADDIAIGAPYDNGQGYEGRVKVYSGASGNTITTLVGSDSSSWRFGWSVAGAGDVNGDGRPDVIVGAPYDDDYYQEAGMAWVFSGDGGEPLRLLFGEALKDGFGWSVAGAGDVDGDGRDDVLVGAPGHDLNGDSSGGAWLHSGRDATVLFKLDGAAEGDLFGWSVAAGSDLNSDGVPDLAVASPTENLTGVDAGAVRLYSGKTGTVGGPFNPGDILVGEIDTFVDVDPVDFIGLKGMTVKLTVSVLEGTLKPRITLIGPDDQIVDKWKLKGGFGDQKIKIKLKASGSYRLEISGNGATLGSYVVFTARKMPKKAKEIEVKKKGTPVAVDLLALPGTTLDATITPLTGYTGAPQVSLSTGDGVPIASAPYSTSSGDVVTLTGVPIALVGVTTLMVEGADGEKPKVKILLTPHQPPAGSGGVLVD